MCGFHALAATISLVNSENPTFLMFTEEQMFCRSQQLSDGNAKQWPSKRLPIRRPTVNAITLKKLHCICQKASHGRMIQCQNYLNWYHLKCVPLDTSQNRCNQWSGAGLAATIPRIATIATKGLPQKDCHKIATKGLQQSHNPEYRHQAGKHLQRSERTVSRYRYALIS